MKHWLAQLLGAPRFWRTRPWRDEFMLALADIEAAWDRIAGVTRRTPVWNATTFVRAPIPVSAKLWLKLELLQATGSFKARGAVNKARALSPEELHRGLVTASGGMREAARWLWSELAIAAEMSGAASVAALLKVRRAESVCALVCGVGRDGWS